MKNGKPVVSIVGRPNVGKSSLFNLLIGERKSIVDEIEGTTRDINIGIVENNDISFYLYDTGGYLEKGDIFNDLVKEKIIKSIEDSELILFMVDGRNYHPYDESIAKILKKFDQKVILIANKIDNREMQNYIYEFYKLGFDKVIPFSVTHKRGLSTLLDLIYDEFCKLGIKNINKEKKENNEEEKLIKLAIVGRPNVGKSLLVNKLLGYERSIVSDIPGTTRDSLDDYFRWNDHKFLIIDTAGLRRKSKVEDDIEYYSNVRTVKAIEKSDVTVLLMDNVYEISQQDKKIANLVLSKGKALVIAYNKWDLYRKSSNEDYFLMEEIKKRTYSEMALYKYIPIEFISALKNYKINKLLQQVMNVYYYYYNRISTSVFNKWLTENIKEADNKKQRSNLKIYYGAQVEVAPPKFVIYINSKKWIRKDFPKYFENKIREQFGFIGTPLIINFREKEKEDIA